VLALLTALTTDASRAPAVSPLQASLGLPSRAAGGPGAGDAAPSAAAAADASAPGVQVVRGNRFIWPAFGPITSYFGPGHPGGIDIGLDWDEDSPVLASAAGTVSFAGGDACCSYGYYVVLEHDHGMTTLYGHFSRILVSEGQQVAQGQLLGLGGDSGESDGKHLHFELREDGRVLDPLRYLSAGRATYVPLLGTVRCPSQSISLDPAAALTLRFPPGETAERSLAAVSLEPLTYAGGVGLPDVLQDGPLSVTLSLPPLASAAGQSASFELRATLVEGQREVVETCRLNLRALTTLPNTESTIARLRARNATPLPTATPTATVRPRPAATPTPLPKTPGPPEPLQQAAPEPSNASEPARRGAPQPISPPSAPQPAYRTPAPR
jgi:hypothetical protein